MVCDTAKRLQADNALNATLGVGDNLGRKQPIIGHLINWSDTTNLFLDYFSYLCTMGYALITGASSGIGRHYVSELAARGYDIVAISNQPEQLQKVADEITAKHGVKVITINCDLAKEEAAQRLYDHCHSKGINVEILICNAGMLLFSTLLATDPKRLTDIINLHCTTTTLLCRLFGEDMKHRQRGRILIMSSATAWLPYPTIAHYGATKAYLKNFASSLWYELRPYNVSVTAIYPGAVDTPFYTLSDTKRRLFRNIGIMTRPEHLAHRAVAAMFRSRRRYIPGIFTKIVVVLCSLIPARLFYPILRIGAIRRLLERI